MLPPLLQNTPPNNDPIGIPGLVAGAIVAAYWAFLQIQAIRANRAKKAKGKTDEHAAAKPSSNGRIDALTDLLIERHEDLETCQKALETKTHDYAELLESHGALVAANGVLSDELRKVKTERDGLRLEVAALKTARQPDKPSFVTADGDEDTTEVKTLKGNT